jgi:DNA-nicking Smr family endonuclease
VTRGKKKPKEPASTKPVKAKAESEGYRPFAVLKGLKAQTEKDTGKAPPAHAEPGPRRRTPPPASLPKGDEDAQILARMMSGVMPLGSKARRIPLSEQRLPTSQIDARFALASTSAREEDEAVHAHLRALVEGGRFEVEDDGQRVEGRRATTPPDVVRKLRRGLLPIDARLDLHGLRADEAQETLERFLGERRSHGERCVLVVHGKGEHSPRGVGILRGEISAWLSQGRASAHVSAFATAQRDDGGEGAVYVLLVR